MYKVTNTRKDTSDSIVWIFKTTGQHVFYIVWIYFFVAVVLLNYQSVNSVYLLACYVTVTSLYQPVPDCATALGRVTCV